MALKALLRRQDGATAVEVALLAPFVITGIMGSLDLGLYVWRWNEAVEAVRVAGRLAAVSDPVSSDISTMTGLETGVVAGQPAGSYERVCSFSTATCTGGSFDQAAADRLFYGRSGGACGDATSRDQAGLCDVAPMIARSTVMVAYRASGVDSAGVAGALRPLVTVRVSGAPANLITLSRIVPGRFVSLPPAEVTLLAEDLSSTS